MYDIFGVSIFIELTISFIGKCFWGHSFLFFFYLTQVLSPQALSLDLSTFHLLNSSKQNRLFLLTHFNFVVRVVR